MQTNQKAYFTDKEKDIFQKGILEFIKRVDECAKIGTTKGSEKSTLIAIFRECLGSINYEANVEFGTGRLKETCGLGFVRKDILRSDCVNTEKFTHTKGLYIYFGYIHSEKKYYLVVGGSFNDNHCIADKIIKSDDYEINYNELDLEKITNDFLKMVDYFNKFKIDDFKMINLAQNEEIKMSNPSLNQILYGPPGTGKTYSSIDKALEILQHFGEIDSVPNERKDKKTLFDKYCKGEDRQIEFVTFHQSFSYEEFVEGIKPKFINSNEGAESSKMEYEIKSGIFKQICKKALRNLEDSQKDEAELKEENKVDNLFEAFIKHIQNEQENGGEYILKQNAEKDKNWLVVLLDSGNYKVIKIFSHSGYLEKYPVFLNGDKIKTYYRDFKTNNSFKVPSQENRMGYIDTHRFYTAFFNKMQEFEINEQKQNNQNEIELDNELKPYILIIDEINRGNISKILGELITLIEPSKRIGGDEELRVTLPYSNESFGVPSNLYIIGTMNTADRSIALLDTALRRRFEFVEMMPDCEHKEISTDCESVNLRKLLKAMNERIEFLLDREHTIGHSFFINVNSLSELQQVFKNKIIPLLQEYFYDDYAKIDAVLNGNGMIKLKKDSTLEKLFDTNFKSDLDSEKVVYQIINSNKWNEKNFLRIYDSSVQIDKDE